MIWQSFSVVASSYRSYVLRAELLVIYFVLKRRWSNVVLLFVFLNTFFMTIDLSYRLTFVLTVRCLDYCHITVTHRQSRRSQTYPLHNESAISEDVPNKPSPLLLHGWSLNFHDNFGL